MVTGPMGTAPGAGATTTLVACLDACARDHGSSPAIREKRRGIWRTLTWSEMAAQVAAVAGGLAARGVGRGSPVVFLGDNRARFWVMTAAVHRLGGVAVPLFADAGVDELRDQVVAAGPTHAFAENQEQVDKLLALLADVPGLGTIVYASDRGMRHYDHPALVAFEALEGAATAAAAVAPGDAAVMFFSPGGGGMPQAVRLSHAALVDRARALAGLGGIGPADAAMAYLPPAWAAQFVVGHALPLVSGAAVCCPESSDTFLADMREIAPSVLVATPRVLDSLAREVERRLTRANGLVRRVAESGGGWLHGMMVAGPMRDQLGLGRLRAGFVAGDLAAAEVLARFERLGVPMVPLYGTTASACVLAARGRAAPGVDLAIGAGEEILARVPALGPDWMATGDAGTLADGVLRVRGRLADMATLADGTRIAPREVENALKRSPFIREAVVFAEGLGEVVALVDIDTQAVGAWANARSLGYTGRAELARHPEVQALIVQAVAEARAGVSLRRAAILDAELDPDDGLLTRIGTLRRAAIAERYAGLIEALAAGGSQAEDGAILGARVGRAA